MLVVQYQMKIFSGLAESISMWGLPISIGASASVQIDLTGIDLVFLISNSVKLETVINLPHSGKV